MKRFRANKKYTIWLTPKVYAASGEYMCNHDCPIATAVRQQLGVKEVGVATHVTINRSKREKMVRYEIVGGLQGPAGASFINHCKKNSLTVPVVLERVN